LDALGADDALEFELVDIESARAAHDAVPPGVGTLPPPAVVWESRRRKPRPTDRALAGVTIDWMLALPAPVRPYALCEQYPRVANALAAAWGNPAQRLALLDDLMFDRRGKRTGFPTPVRTEIETLRYDSSVTGRG
jgi:hypothetical protein